MSCRAQAALWILCVIAALAILPGACGSPAGLRQFQARTESLYGLVDPRAARRASSLALVLAHRLPETAAGGIHAASALPGRAALEHGIGRWVSWWRIVVARIALLAGAGLAGLPLVAAGVADGIAMRRARRSDRAAGSPLAATLGAHAIVALLFAPVLWCTLPLATGAGTVALWLVATAAAAAFTLSNAPGITAR